MTTATAAAPLGALPEKAEPYRVSFDITGPGAAGLKLLAQVEARVSEWLASRSQEPQFDLDAPEGTWSDDDYEISIERDSLGDAGYASFKWECEDRRAPGFWLRLDLDLATEGGEVTVCAESYFLEQDDTEPPDLLSGPPTVIHELLDAFDCFLGEERLSGEVTWVSPDTAPEFAAGRVLFQSRRLPIVAVSQDGRGNTVIDPARLQQYLSGVASVAAYDRAAPRVLWQHFGRALACHGGDIRVYWPGCALHDESKVHKVWRWREVDNLGFHRLIRQLQGECLRRVAPAFDRDMFESIRWTVEREKLRMRLAEFEEQSRYEEQSRHMEAEQESAAESEAWIGELEASVANLERQLAEKDTENRRLQDRHDEASREIAQLQQTIDDLRYQIAEKEKEISERRQKLETVEQPAASAADRGRISEMELTVAELKRQLGRRTDELKRRTAELSEYQKQAQRSADTAGRIEELEQSVADLNGRLTEKDKEIGGLKAGHSFFLRRKEQEIEQLQQVFTNSEWVGTGLRILKLGLLPFVQQSFVAYYGDEALPELQSVFHDESSWQDVLQRALNPDQAFREMDAAALLKVMHRRWRQVYINELDDIGPAQQTLVSNLRKCRNDWAHQRSFSAGEAYAALDSMRRLLSGIESPQSGAVERLTAEHLKVYPSAQSANYRRAA